VQPEPNLGLRFGTRRILVIDDKARFFYLPQPIRATRFVGRFLVASLELASPRLNLCLQLDLAESNFILPDIQLIGLNHRALSMDPGVGLNDLRRSASRAVWIDVLVIRSAMSASGVPQDWSIAGHWPRKRGHAFPLQSFHFSRRDTPLAATRQLTFDCACLAQSDDPLLRDTQFASSVSARKVKLLIHGVKHTKKRPEFQ
jgi:hypothetical protein